MDKQQEMDKEKESDKQDDLETEDPEKMRQMKSEAVPWASAAAPLLPPSFGLMIFAQTKRWFQSFALPKPKQWPSFKCLCDIRMWLMHTMGIPKPSTLFKMWQPHIKGNSSFSNILLNFAL